MFFSFFCRYNSSLDEYRLEDSDERARRQRAIEIQEGIEIDQVTSSDLIESLTSHHARTDDQQLQEHCKKCQQNQLQYRQMGVVQQALLLTDDENNLNPRYHSQVRIFFFVVYKLISYFFFFSINTFLILE